MAIIKMEIQAESAEDLRETLARLLGSVSMAVAVDPVPAAKRSPMEHERDEAPVADKPKAAGRPKKADPAPTAPASLPTVQEATEAAEATVAMSEGDGSSAGAAVADAAAPAAGADASYDDVKKALVDLMDKKSASVVQGLLKEHFGVPAISQMDKSRYGEAVAKLREWANAN